MDKQDKPRICEVLCKALDVEAGEEFEYKCNKFVIRRSDGLIYYMDYCGGWNRVEDVTEIAEIVEHPDRILRQPRFTEDEVAAMRVLCTGGAKTVIRNKNAGLFWSDGIMQGDLPTRLFPSIRPGQSVEIAGVLGGRD